jgi:hydrogenase nickel incorporation protein HypB
MRARFEARGIYVVNVVSGPGAGKTALLSALRGELASRGVEVAAVVGDLATENDARRLNEAGIRARQILTGTMCHLEADMVEGAVADLDLDGVDLLFIENVGNLVCPQSWDLGEDMRMLLFNSTEGEDKPLKYPTLINTCDLVVFSKMDLAEPVGFDRGTARRNCQDVRPGVPMVDTSARTGHGLPELAEMLAERARLKRQRGTAGSRDSS